MNTINKLDESFYQKKFQNIFILSVNINLITYLYFRIFIMNFEYFIFYYLQPLLILGSIYYDYQYNNSTIRRYIFNKDIKYNEVIMPQILNSFINTIQLFYNLKYGIYYRSFSYLILLVIYNKIVVLKEDFDSQKIRFFLNFVYFIIIYLS